MISKHDYYLNIAESVAGKSTCLKRKYGAVIVNHDEIISTGYNGAPRGRKNCTDLQYCIRKEMNIPSGCDNFESCCRSVHAEMNAIISASRRDMIGSSLFLIGYSPETGDYYDTEPCSICKRMIINAGINYVYIRTDTDETKIINVNDWIEHDESLPNNDKKEEVVEQDKGNFEIKAESLEDQMSPKKTYEPDNIAPKIISKELADELNWAKLEKEVVIKQPVRERSLEYLNIAEGVRRKLIRLLRGELENYNPETLFSFDELFSYQSVAKQQVITMNDGSRRKLPAFCCTKHFITQVHNGELLAEDIEVILLYLLGDDKIVGNVPEEYIYEVSSKEIYDKVKKRAFIKLLKNLSVDSSIDEYLSINNLERSMIDNFIFKKRVLLPISKRVVYIPQYLTDNSYLDLHKEDKNKLLSEVIKILIEHEPGSKDLGTPNKENKNE